MITIAKRVEQLIEQWPLLRQGLELDLLNTSAVARYLKPEVEREVGERVSEAAVLMALRRYQEHNEELQTQHPQDFLGDMSLRSNLVDLTYANSPTLPRILAKFAHDLTSEHYLTISRGVLQTSVVIHEHHAESVKNALQKEQLIVETPCLTAITLHLTQGHDYQTGILAYPLQLLAWRGIPVVELVSTNDEFNIILYDKDVNTAFTTLNQALN